MNTGIIPQRVTVVLGETAISYDDLQKIGEGEYRSVKQ
jgi:hypothetical protein